MGVVPHSAVTLYTPGGPRQEIDDQVFQTCVAWYLRRWNITRMGIDSFPSRCGEFLWRVKALISSLVPTQLVPAVMPKNRAGRPQGGKYRAAALAGLTVLLPRQIGRPSVCQHTAPC
jgi:hypothetical protein